MGITRNDIGGGASALARKSSWRDRPLTERAHAFTEIVVPHPSFVKICEAVNHRSSRVRLWRKSDGAVVIAPTGTGKTFLAKYIAAQRPDRDHQEGTEKPVIYFSVPSGPTLATMSKALLRGMGDPLPDKGTHNSRTERIVELLNACKTEILLVDNVHDIPEHRRLTGVRGIGNWIRDLMDAIPMLVMLLGAHSAISLSENNEQVRRRNPGQYHMPYFSVDTKEDVQIFRRFLVECDNRLPMADPSPLGDPETVIRMHCATFGVIDYVMELLGEALIIAVESNRESICLDDLKQAFDMMFADAALDNPFKQSFVPRRLDQPGDLFHAWNRYAVPQATSKTKELRHAA